MKYFTKELWEGFNTVDDDLFQRTWKQWERNRKAYFRQLESLTSRLSKSAARFFAVTSLHDGRLLAFGVGDHINCRKSDLKSLSRNKGHPEVRIEVLNFEQNWLYYLNYAKVRTVLFDFPGGKPLFHEEGGRIDDWGYDELTAAGKSYLRHEILFSSSATILIEFQKFSYEKIPIKSSKGPVF